MIKNFLVLKLLVVAVFCFHFPKAHCADIKKENPFFYYTSTGDAYNITQIGIFQPQKNQLGLLDIYVRTPLLKKGKFNLMFSTEILTPYSVESPPFYISSDGKLLLRYDLFPALKPFFVMGYASLKGEDHTLGLDGLHAGIGAEFFLKHSPFYFYAYLEGGTLLLDGSIHPYVNSRYSLRLFSVPLTSGERALRFTFNMDAKVNWAGGVDDLGLYAEFGPRIGLLFPNGFEFSANWKLQYSRGYPFQNYPDRTSSYIGIQMSAPLMPDAPSTEGTLRKDAYYPTLSMILTLGAGYPTSMSELNTEFTIPFFTRRKFQFAFDTNFILSRYYDFSDSPNISFHFFNAGPRFLFFHPSSRDAEHQPYWNLSAYFNHRSEHASDPSENERKNIRGGNPESLSVQISSPYWKELLWNENREKWYDYVSFSLLFNKFIFLTEDEDPFRANASFSIRPGILVNIKKAAGGLVYLRGEKAIGTEFLNWRIEAGWKHRSWDLFARAENFKAIRPLGGQDGTYYYLGGKFYYSMLFK